MHPNTPPSTDSAARSNIPNDYAIYASSVRLPFLAAGLVNSALAVLLSQLSNQFFKMAIIQTDAKHVESEPDEDQTMNNGPGQIGQHALMPQTSPTEMDTNNTTNSNNYGYSDGVITQKPQSTSSLIDRRYETKMNDYDVTAPHQQSHLLTITPNAFTASQPNPSNNNDDGNDNTPQHQLIFTQVDGPDFQHTSTNQTEHVKVKQEVDTEFATPMNMAMSSNDFPNFVESQSVINPPNGDFNQDAANPTRVTTVNYLKRHACTYPGCGKIFFSRTSLLYHKQSHAVDKPYRCLYPGCNLNFSSEAILKTHSQLHDSKQVREKFPCTLPGCNKLFSNRECLIEHIRIHTGERPFACDFSGCSHRFARRCNLFAHKRVHLDKNQRRQYHCIHPGCGKTFLYARSLTEHMNVHLGERPYVCDYPNCTRSFTSKSYLYAHRRIHLGVSRATTNISRTFENENMPPIPVTVTMPVTQAFPYQFPINYPNSNNNNVIDNKSILSSSITSPSTPSSSTSVAVATTGTNHFYYNQPN